MLKTLANPFQYHGHDIRIAFIPNISIFVCVNDVFSILEIALDEQARLVETLTNCLRIEGEGLYFVKEDDLRLIPGMSETEGDGFSCWLKTEVLSKIRNTSQFYKTE